LTSYDLKKNDKKFSAGTGGTLTIHRRNPVLGSAWSVGLILENPEIVQAEPNIGILLIRQGYKSRQLAISTRETIFKIFKNSWK
jgi:hypothetical protein